ncbi:hypothetical protein LJC31_00500 [Synergistaceae bacterium OttesenSCG-928-I11]|nr:hypothetical protein [Synergistaceae bacterium OttesenSCG-928-I11]
MRNPANPRILCASRTRRACYNRAMRRTLIGLNLAIFVNMVGTGMVMPLQLRSRGRMPQWGTS